MSSAKTHRKSRAAGRKIQRLRISVVSGPDRGKVFEPDVDAPISIGSSPDNAVVLADRAVSRYHLELSHTRDGVRVADLGSLNGTLIGGLRVERVIAPPGTKVEIGGSVLVLEEGRSTGASEQEAGPKLPGIMGDSPAIRETARQARRLADSNAVVLILGETGTGKELFARAMHACSPRAAGPFVVVDCGSLAPTLIASELFGHERGAFTGADQRYIGAFERADGGSIFLDEVGELPLAVQPALLGALERRRFRRVGGDSEIAIDVRVISATHRDLRAEVNRGQFRADLYFRLAVARLLVPPLRERREDIPALVQHFVEELGSGSSPFGAETLDALSAHPWSGNVRELRNVVESALAMGQVTLEGEAAPPRSGARTARAARADSLAPPFAPYRDARAQALARFELDYLSRLLEAAGKNISEAARRARMDRPYLLTLLRKHKLR